MTALAIYPQCGIKEVVAYFIIIIGDGCLERNKSTKNRLQKYFKQRKYLFEAPSSGGKSLSFNCRFQQQVLDGPRCCCGRQDMEPKGGTSLSSPRGPQSSNLSYQVDKPFILNPTCLWWKCFLSDRTENSGWRAALKDRVWKTTKHFWWPDRPHLFMSTLANSHIVLRRKSIPPRLFC